MKFENDINDHRLALEITPLIDVIFLLVLFFAVTTSFNSPEEINALKKQVLQLTDAKQQLLGEISKHAAQVSDQARLIQNLKDNYSKLETDYTRVLDAAKEQTQESSTQLQAAETKTEQLLGTIAALQQKLADETARSRQLDQQKQRLETDRQTQRDASARLTNAIAALKDKNNQLQLALDEKTQQHQNTELTLAALLKEQDTLQQRLADETARSRQLDQQNQKLETDRQALRDASARLTNAIAALEDKNNQLQLALDEKNQQHQKTELGLEALAKEHGILQQKLAEEATRSQQLGQQNQKLELTIKTLEQDQADLQQKLSDETARSRQFDQQNQKLELTIKTLEQNQANVQQKFADQTAHGQEIQQQNKELETELRTQMDKAGRLTNTIATLLDENERLQQVLKEKSAKNQELDQLLVKERQNGQTLSTELTRLKQAKADRETNEKLLIAKIEQLEEQVAKSREFETSTKEWGKRLDRAQKNLDTGLKTYFQQNKIGIQREHNRLILQLPDQILFDSGSADVKPQGLTVLRKVGEILKTDLSNMLIQIGGHTDNVPVSSAKGSLFPSNWELSAARAVNVVHFFETALGIDPQRMSAVGYSEYRPIAPNTTEEGRARNRRIEIIVLQP